MRVHSGEKPFVCSQCNYSCNQAGRLWAHMRIHSGEKPYSCKQCNYSSTREHILKKHMLTCSGERSPLPAISVASLTGGQAGWHITWKKLFACNKCKYSFMQSPDLKKHICTRHQHQANDLFLWYWPCFVMINRDSIISTSRKGPFWGGGCFL